MKFKKEELKKEKIENKIHKSYYINNKILNSKRNMKSPNKM